MDHQAIYLPGLSHTLLLPMKVCVNDVIVNQTPQFLVESPNKFTHSIIIPDDNMDYPYMIPLALLGVTSTFSTRKPTTEEFESLPCLCLTSADPPYDLHDTILYPRNKHSPHPYGIQGTELGPTHRDSSAQYPTLMRLQKHLPTEPMERSHRSSKSP
jgi:hypothetical protein